MFEKCAGEGEADNAVGEGGDEAEVVNELVGFVEGDGGGGGDVVGEEGEFFGGGAGLVDFFYGFEVNGGEVEMEDGCANCVDVEV